MIARASAAEAACWSIAPVEGRACLMIFRRLLLCDMRGMPALCGMEAERSLTNCALLRAISRIVLRQAIDAPERGGA